MKVIEFAEFAEAQAGAEPIVLKKVPIFRAGDYRAAGKGIITTKDLKEIESNFQKLKKSGELAALPIKGSHDHDNYGRPVLGWIEDGVKAVGNTLYADFTLVSEAVADLFKSKAYRFRSVELHDKEYPWQRNDGTSVPNVLRGVAMVLIPQVPGLGDIKFGDGTFNVNFGLDDKGAKYTTIDFDRPEEPEEKPEDGGHDDAGDTESEGGSADETPEAGEQEAPEDAEGSATGDDASSDDAGGEQESGAGEPDPAVEGDGEQESAGDDESVDDEKPKDPPVVKSEKNYGKTYGFSTVVDEQKKPEANIMDPIRINEFSKEDVILARVENVKIEDAKKIAFDAEVSRIKSIEERVENKIAEYTKSGKLVPAQSEFAKTLMSPALALVAVSFGKDEEDKEIVFSISEIVEKLIDAGSPKVDFSETAKAGGDAESDEEQGKSEFDKGEEAAEKILKDTGKIE